MCNVFADKGKMPVSVLKRIQQELMDYNVSGQSVIEWSNSSVPIVELLARVQDKLRRLLKLQSGSEVLLLQGGGSLRSLW